MNCILDFQGFKRLIITPKLMQTVLVPIRLTGYDYYDYAREYGSDIGKVKALTFYLKEQIDSDTCVYSWDGKL